MVSMKNTHVNRLPLKYATFVIEYVKDFAARRAAEASGYAPEYSYILLEREDIKEAIHAIVEERLENVGIDAEWLLFELVDNHRIARHQGNINASNTALKTLAQHVSIDALAKQKVDHTSSDKSIVAVPCVSAEVVRRIAEDLDKELSPDKEVSFF